MKKKIMLYNILTTVFAILTVISLGGIAYGVNIVNVVINTALFAFLTSKCFKNENKLRAILRKRILRARKRKLIYLENYKANKEITKRAI